MSMVTSITAGGLQVGGATSNFYNAHLIVVVRKIFKIVCKTSIVGCCRL